MDCRFCPDVNALTPQDGVMHYPQGSVIVRAGHPLMARPEAARGKAFYRTRIRGGFMKMRLTRHVPARDAWLTAGRFAAGALLAAVTVSACTSGSASSTPSIF